MGGKKEKVHLSTYDTNVIQFWNTNNKMATPAPVQLQLPVTVSDLVCCVFVYDLNHYTHQDSIPKLSGHNRKNTPQKVRFLSRDIS